MNSKFRVSARFRTARTRLAAGFSALGLVAVSTGLVMITAPTVHAAVGDAVCHVTASDQNPYIYQSPDGSSTDPSEAHAAHSEAWKRGTWWNNVWYPAGSVRRDIVGGLASPTYCNANGEVGARLVTPDLTLTQPSCANGNRGTWSAVAMEGVSYDETSGTGGPNETVTVSVTLDPGYELAAGAANPVVRTFGAAEPSCDGTGGETDPTVVTPLEPEWIEAGCTTDPRIDYNAVTGVTYTTSGTVAPEETATVTARASNSDYVLADVESSWSHRFDARPGVPPCPGDDGGTPGGNPGGGGGGPATPTNVVPLEPSWTEPTCSTPAGVEYRSVDGVAYVTEGDVAPGNRVVVRAEALEDHSFADGTVTWWAHTFDTPQRCGGGDTDGGGDGETDGEEPTVGKPSPTVKGVQKFRPPTGEGDNVQPGTGGPHAVPTAVAAGLTDFSGGHGSPSTFSSPQLAQALVAGGLLLLVVGGGLGLGRRTNGAHEF